MARRTIFAEDKERGKVSSFAARKILAAWALKIIALATLIYLTTNNVIDRIDALWTYAAYVPLAIFSLLWALCIASFAVASFHPKLSVRCAWGVPLALTGALAFTFRHFTATDLNPQEILSLWQARHEAGRALAFYASAVPIGLGMFAFAFAAIVAPPVPSYEWVKRKSPAWAWLPLLPIAAISCVLIAKSGTSHTGFPPQFSLLSILAYSAEKIATTTVEPRNEVNISPASPLADHILLLVDESIRPDYVNLDPSKPLTPEMARFADRIVDFGPAASGGNCSHYSNAILRFTAARHNLTESINRNPTLFSYAKKAGYRTVYIDGQAPRIKDTSIGSRFQNFMTFSETLAIDQIYVPESNLPTPDLDFYVLDMIEKEFAKPGKVFIYANKNGAHVPYVADYPHDGAGPGLETPQGSGQEALNSEYRNAVRWNVSRFFEQFFVRVDLRSSATLYTSDHGQSLEAGKATHCVQENPDPRQGYVPMMAIIGDTHLRSAFTRAAGKNFAKTSHFEVAPTVLELMGYASPELNEIFETSIFKELPAAVAFTSGDIFGVVSKSVQWNAVSLSADYLEEAAKAAIERHRLSLQQQ